MTRYKKGDFFISRSFDLWKVIDVPQHPPTYLCQEWDGREWTFMGHYTWQFLQRTTVPISRLTAVVLYGVTDESTNELCNQQ